MQANWSLMLNILLLMMVIIAIMRLMRARKNSLSRVVHEPSLDQKPSFFQDEIISVRKINTESNTESVPEVEQKPIAPEAPKTDPHQPPKTQEKLEPAAKIPSKQMNQDAPPVLMMFLLAKENRQFAGYEMLQTILSAGLRFGEGQLFHRHQFANGQGPVLCSLAAATNSGVFDLQNIGAFSVRGLCLFMQASDNPNIDEERFTIMLDTARQLSEGLDAHLLDDKRRPLTEQRIARYYQLLNLHALS